MYQYASAGHPSQSEVFNGCGSIRQCLGHRLSLLRTFFKNIFETGSVQALLTEETASADPKGSKRNSRSDRSRPFKPVDVRGAGAKKVEKVQTFTLTSFSDAQQHKVITHTFGSAIRANNIPESCKRLDRVFSIVVVSRYPVVTEESEQSVPTFLEPSPVASCRFGLIVALSQRFIEAGH